MTDAKTEQRPDSKLMRVPIETYQAIADSAKGDRRAMNQQLAVLVDEALAARTRRNSSNGAGDSHAAG